MRLLVIVLCLLSERFLVHKVSFKRFAWFSRFAAEVGRYVGAVPFFASPWWTMAAMVLLPVLFTALILYVSCGWIYGLVGFVLQLAIFFLCLGPENPFYPEPAKEGAEEGEQAREYFSQVNGQLFAPIFWYILAGASGVLAYRLIALGAREDGMKRTMGFLAGLLEWVPARMEALLCLLVGNFQQGASFLLAGLLKGPSENAHLLAETATRALGKSAEHPAGMPEAEVLVEHALVLLLVVLALFTLVAWL
ncbi:inner membrane protein AmpE [Legionella geestiana]|uniref:Inner membrane protein AmpE n=1 Tax=Legionella geestiana TaxID=45065 RepID=A0A0W0TNB2_9GAMM|nr:hypothetical protein [Legionella geestiana]KTC97068.1 inner membrane protein AmpE [Legionella geestiana]QBS11426.1 hypothetical protein E4T54_00975 [Legionella geestiana]QDQ38983.1 hypothetical protein E3226_000465 [Legionella geestiana]STX53914.1 inner membrane protein AmpE [Legionella geestiana]